MENSIKQQAEAMGLTLPTPPEPGGHYSAVQVRGNIGYVAIQFPIQNGVPCCQGKIGSELSTEQGYQAMRLCALNVLAQIDRHITMDQLEGLNHIVAYYQSTDDWDEAPILVNGASDLFIEALQEKGQHSRSLLGVNTLPKKFSVGLTATFTIRKQY